MNNGKCTCFQLAHNKHIQAINLHYTLGHDIYIGWITGCFAIGGAVVTICSSMGTPDDDEDDNEVDIEAVRQKHYKECFDVQSIFDHFLCSPRILEYRTFYWYFVNLYHFQIERFKKKDSYSTYQAGRSSQQQYI